MNTEQAVKKRGWAKNAAIIFLIVMLVLTFFSNTIMNRALPEVAAQFASPGTITARIRGMGTVSANDSFEVILNQTRTVSEVNVRLGNEVAVGDVLFTLTGAGSEELEEARDALDALVRAYERMVINASLNGDYERELRTIRIARETLEEAQAALAGMPYSPEALAAAQVALGAARAARHLAETRVDTAELAEEAALAARNRARDLRNDAREVRDEAQATVTAREAAVAAARAALDALTGANTGPIDIQIANKQAEIASVQNERDAAWIFYGANYTEFARLAQATLDPTSTLDPLVWASQNPVQMAAYALMVEAYDDTSPLLLAYEEITRLDNRLNTLAAELSDLQQQRQGLLGTNSTEYNRLLTALRNAESALATARTALRTAEDALAPLETALTNAERTLTAATAELTNAERAFTEAGRAVSAAEDELETQEGYQAAWQAANNNIRTLQNTLEDLIFDLSEEQKRDGVQNAITALDMRDQRNQINRKREEIRRLEEDETGSTIVSTVSGIVRQINISPGQTTTSGMPLAVIEVVDRGFSLSFPVTLEQSRRVSIGDTAEVNRGWWATGDIHARLMSIRNDPQNPATSRILDFDISGEVESGEQLNITIGQRSEQFEVIVPNSAIRSDTNGDFVLVILSRSSPLGNRYIATRADVIVLSSDDTHTAVTGGLSSWDFVVTTSTRPIEPGMQIRLVDNP